MNLTNSQRARKLIGSLAANPDLIFPYLRTSVFSRKLPMDHGMPWWSFRAIERADSLVAGKRLFEYGSGGSTLRFAASAKSIVSVENDARWAALIQDRIDSRKIQNVEVLCRPFDFRNPIDFENSPYIACVDRDEWDIVIIDGQDWTFRERISCFRRAEPRMKAGSVIIVDDFWRYEELLQSNRARSVEIFESVGPCRLGVTSTAFFHYS